MPYSTVYNNCRLDEGGKKHHIALWFNKVFTFPAAHVKTGSMLFIESFMVELVRTVASDKEGFKQTYLLTNTKMFKDVLGR